MNPLEQLGVWNDYLHDGGDSIVGESLHVRFGEWDLLSVVEKVYIPHDEEDIPSFHEVEDGVVLQISVEAGIPGLADVVNPEVLEPFQLAPDQKLFWLRFTSDRVVLCQSTGLADSSRWGIPPHLIDLLEVKAQWYEELTREMMLGVAE